MKIVIVNTSDAGGGAERISSTLAKGLREQGHKVSFICSTAHFPESRSTMGVVDWLLGRMLKQIGFADSISLGALRFLHYPEVREADVIHFHNLHGFYFGMAMLPKIIADKPCLWTLHDCWALSGGCYSHLDCRYQNCKNWLHSCRPCFGHGVFPMTGLIDTAAVMLRLKQKALGAMVRHGGLVNGVSQWMTQRAVDAFTAAGLDDSSVKCIPNFVDIPSDENTWPALPVSVPLGKPVVLLVGANIYSHAKGISTALCALRCLLHRPYTLLIIGTPLPFSVLHEYGLEDRTIQVGRLDDRSMLGAFYGAATVTLVPSMAESFSLVAAESIACGTPVIASNVMALPDIVREGVTGFLAEANNAEDFARKLFSIMEMHTDEYRQLRLFARNFAKDHFVSLISWLNSYVELYDQVIRGHINV